MTDEKTVTCRFNDHKSAAMAADALIQSGVPIDKLHLTFDPEQLDTVRSSVHPTVWARIKGVLHPGTASKKQEGQSEPARSSMNRHGATLTVSTDDLNQRTRSLLDQYSPEYLST